MVGKRRRVKGGEMGKRGGLRVGKRRRVKGGKKRKGYGWKKGGGKEEG